MQRGRETKSVRQMKREREREREREGVMKNEEGGFE